MLGECLFAVEDALAGGGFGGVVEGAEPAGEVQVLGGFVAFPVCFAAEGFGAVWECAAVGAFVAFLVFSREGGRGLDWMDGWGREWLLVGDLLHFAAETGAFGAHVTLEPILFLVVGFRCYRGGII